MPPTPSSILISRADAIGDVVLTLPMVRILKQRFPQAVVGFLAKPYTHPVLEACPDIDEIVALEDFLREPPTRNWDTIIHVFPKAEVAARAKHLRIPARIGTTNRTYHWWTCNRLVRLSRKRSKLHEAQLNVALMEPLSLARKCSVEELGRMVTLVPTSPLPDTVRKFLTGPQPKVVLHPSSRGSAREWSLENFAVLAKLLADAGLAVAVTGVESDREDLQSLLTGVAGFAENLVGQLSLAELMTFLQRCDGVVAASTGPLHLAAILGVATIGLYPPERPMHAGRWAPLGRFVKTLTGIIAPNGGKQNVLEGISPEDVLAALMQQMDLRKRAGG